MNGSSTRDRLLDAAADYLLAHGVHPTLRPLADAVGTSPRMLMHYFGSRDALIEEALLRLSDRLRDDLDARRPSRERHGKVDPGWVIRAVTSQSGLTGLWFDVLAGAARETEPFVTVARRISDNWLRWVSSVLDLDEPGAAAVLAVAEGIGVVRVARGDDVAEAAWDRLRETPPAATSPDLRTGPEDDGEHRPEH